MEFEKLEQECNDKFTKKNKKKLFDDSESEDD